MNMEDRIFEVVIPLEDVVELKNGKRQVVSRKVFPGYLMVRMDLDDDSWYVVRNTPGVTGFVGLGARPTPLSPREVENILAVKVGRGRHRKEDPSPPRVRGGRVGPGQGKARSPTSAAPSRRSTRTSSSSRCWSTSSAARRL